ncbi:MAG: sugar phosphate isomerase/epimerase [Chitinophagaceae bacterium]|nr:sugar phosphate isomerase/epimerase [Chitinophagaceae bacterium]
MTANNEKQFKLKILATDWGFAGSFDQYCIKVKEEGYDGIETVWPNTEKEQLKLLEYLKKYSLEAGFLCTTEEADFNEHFSSFKRLVTGAANVNPLFINCHSGRDHFSYEENKAFIDFTIDLSARTGVRISHETHRARMLYSAPAGRVFMERDPGLRITLDVSHWCNVSESFLHDQQKTMQLAIERTDHIHARIGYEEGPQVTDPRAPEWENAVNAHLAWWDKIVERKRKNGETLTILTEFGPPNYLHTLPFTAEPVADQWAINVYMMHLLRKRYQ